MEVTKDTSDGNGEERWDAYLSDFHRDRPGITEQILRVSRDDTGATAYDWVVEAIPAEGLVVDVACGSAPLWSPTLVGRYLGIDSSAEELKLAARRGARETVQTQASAIPVADGAAGAVVCSMALMILPDVPDVLAEIRRVLQPGGTFVATVPTGLTSAKDVAFAAGLVAALGHAPKYRNDAALKSPHNLFHQSGLRLTGDERRRFLYSLRDDGAAEAMAASLYFPDDGTGADREARASRYLRRVARVQAQMPVPIRRLVGLAI